MSVTRDKLYEEVWAEPMAKVAVRYRCHAAPSAAVTGERFELAQSSEG